jgi:hypothetical protein
MVQYCGFISWSDGIAAFMPRNSEAGSETSESACYLLQALKRYYSDKTSGVFEGLENELIGSVSLSLAAALVDDYLANGLYVRRRRQLTLNHGRPNWKRTISKQTPYPSNSAPIYLDLETSRNSYISDCETARIHARVMREINEDYGVLLLGQERMSDYRLRQLPEPLADNQGRLAMLERELSVSYSERDMRLIRMLKQYVENSSNTDGSGLMVGTRHFQNVWEGMLDTCLPGKKPINSTLPVPYYQQGAHYFEAARYGQRTDTVIVNHNEDRWAVIDAKYYAASGVDSAPGWHDLVKQFFYKTAAEEISGNGVTVTLHFIFPGSKQNLIKAKVGARDQGKTHVDQFMAVAKYGEILCHYCEPIALLKKYVDSAKLDISQDKDVSGLIFK